MTSVNEAQRLNQEEPFFRPEERKGATVVVASSEGERANSEPGDKHDEWRPGFWSQFPWRGIGALVGVVLCSAACVIVVYLSNGKAQSQWKIKAAPNVLLSIFTAVASILVTLSVGQGIAIAWWRRAMKGTTVEDLHNSWSFASSVVSIVTKYKSFNIMALAALCTKFAIIDSTLFQKALTTSTALGPPQNTVTAVYPIEQFPNTGTLNQYGNDTSTMSFAMTYLLNYWLSSSDGVNLEYLNGFGDCQGLCNLTYRGVGFASSCSYTNTTVSRSQAAVNGGDDLLFNVEFALQFPTNEKNYSYINMNWASWVSDSGNGANEQCNGELVNLTCELRPAIIDYSITVQNSSFSSRDPKEKGSNYIVYLGALNVTGGYYEGPYDLDDINTSQQVPNHTVISYLDVPESQTAGGNTSLGGIAFALQTYYQSHSTVRYQSETTTTNGQNQTIDKPVVSSTGLMPSYAQLEDYQDNCPIGYTSPLDTSDSATINYDAMLVNINILTLLVSDDLYLRANYTGDIYAYDDFYYNYTNDIARYVTTTQLHDETYYFSRIAYAWGAFASTLVVVALILPSYWGFWQLGRKVSLGPLEIANAFDAPAFSHAATGSGHVDGVLKAVGKEKVQYGGQEHEVHGVKYGFGRAENV